jgi:hypothetical protein
MGPTILLDKSAFQSLSSLEMNKLTKYFIWNRVDILYIEILADYLKKTKTTSPRNEASILADKIQIVYSAQNVNYKTLFRNNLLGLDFEMDGRIVPAILDGEQTVAYIDETSFCELINRWQRGDFKEEDKYFAERWRKIIANYKADDYLLQCLTSNHIIIPKSTSIDELGVEIDKLLRNPDMQQVFLEMFLSYLAIDSATKCIIKNRLSQIPYSLQKFAPYAFYCLRVFTLFLGANKFNLIPMRPTNWIDLTYLFYLPFCHVFSTDDKFHKTLSPALMRKNQVFLTGADLKKGLQELEILPSYKETMKAKCFPIPPMPKESIIRDVWIKTKWLYD